MKISIANLQSGITQSEIIMFDLCPRKWYFAYNLLLSGAEPNLDFMIGTAWHKIMASMYANGGEVPEEIVCEWEPGTRIDADSSALMEHWQRILRVYAEEYARHYKDEFANLQVEHIEQEIDLTVPWKGLKIRLRGVIDLMGTLGGIHRTYDWKTNTGINPGTLRGWQFRFQFMFYLWLVRKALKIKSKFIVGAMIKPTIRVKQCESSQGYVQRLRGLIRTTPSDYFQREPLLLGEGAMDKFESEVLAPKLDRFAILQRFADADDLMINDDAMSALMGPNTGACLNQFGKPCTFLEICEGKIKAEKFNKRKIKHTEITCQPSKQS